MSGFRIESARRHSGWQTVYGLELYRYLNRCADPPAGLGPCSYTLVVANGRTRQDIPGRAVAASAEECGASCSPWVSSVNVTNVIEHIITITRHNVVYAGQRQGTANKLFDQCRLQHPRFRGFGEGDGSDALVTFRRKIHFSGWAAKMEPLEHRPAPRVDGFKRDFRGLCWGVEPNRAEGLEQEVRGSRRKECRVSSWKRGEVRC